MFVPASGNVNQGAVEDVGANGNLWSASLNSQNISKAWNPGFNDEMADIDNDNRYNGYPVRGVLAQILYLIIYICTISQKNNYYLIYM